MIKTLKALEAYIKAQDNMYLYGAGKRAGRFIGIFRGLGIEFDGCIVSERGNNAFELDGVPVYAVADLEIKGIEASDLNVFVSLRGTPEELIPVFEKGPVFKSLLFCSEQLDFDIHDKWYVKYEFEKRQSCYRMHIAYPQIEPTFGVLADRKTGTALMRIPYYLGTSLLEPLLETGTRENLEREFGPMLTLPHIQESGLSQEAAQKEKIEIYVVNSHMDKAQSRGSLPYGYIPIQVGAALTEIRKGCLTDDTGDHISQKNRDYCECTGLYWIWKNTSGQEYVGLCHYRRRLMLNDAGVQFIKAHDIDIVPTIPQYEIVSTKEFFEGFIETNDWKLLKKFVSAYDAEYEKCFKIYEEGHFYFPCNVMLWKRKWFDRYCEFAFSIAEKIEQVYADMNIFREDRYMGYLFEQLSSVFIMRHRKELKIACSEIEWVE